MSDTNKKQNFLHGAALLAAAVAIVKVIGAFYKIPLRNIIGDLGYGYFITAYDIYSIFLTISTAGLPIAMSRMITQENSLEHYRSMRRVYRVSQTIFMILGVTCSLTMLIFSGQLADLLKQPGAVPSIVCLAPCAALMCAICPFRGFFQGQENMRPTSVSQVLEAIVKLIVGLALAYAVKRTTGSDSLAAGAAILGVTASCASSVIYLYAKFRPTWKALPTESDEEVPSVGKTIKNLLAIAVPITIGSAGLYAMNVIESGVYMRQLVSLIETGRYDLPLIDALKTDLLATTPNLSAEELYSQTATSLKGIYNFGQTIFNMPVSFISPITISVMPAITAQLTLKNSRQVRSIEESSARVAGLLSAPCCIGLCLLAGPVMSLLGGYGGEGLNGMKLELGEKLMFLLGVGILPHALVMYTNVILQAHGRFNIPVINMMIVALVRLPMVYFLVGNPALGIMGVPISAMICNAANVAMNLVSIHFIAPEKPHLLRNLLKPMIPALIMGVVVFGVRQGIIALSHGTPSNVILCGACVLAGACVYAFFAVVCKVITYEDCLLLPKGEKLAKVLKL